MTQREDKVRLRHMLDYSRKAVAMIEGRVREDLGRDEMLCLALTRAVEIVGEAATRVSPAGQKRHGQIPWAEIIGLRKRSLARDPSEARCIAYDLAIYCVF